MAGTLSPEARGPLIRLLGAGALVIALLVVGPPMGPVGVGVLAVLLLTSVVASLQIVSAHRGSRLRQRRAGSGATSSGTGEGASRPEAGGQSAKLSPPPRIRTDELADLSQPASRPRSSGRKR